MGVGHPARFSRPIIDTFTGYLKARYPHGVSATKPVIVDPMAGSGERLAELGLATNMRIYGIEIELEFIEDPCVHVGDSTNAFTYPPFDRWIVVTSPPYPNGVADAHAINDTSKRYTYTAALGRIPNANSLAAYGYRSTRRDGRSTKRQAYWELADRIVANWDTAELVLLNVSDFFAKRGGVVEREPVVQDWAELLGAHGWAVTATIPIETTRMRNGANRDQRVEAEQILVAERA